MSPYPAQITREVIIEQGWRMLAEHGAEGLTLAKLGEALGVKAASLYHHVANKSELLKGIHRLTIDRLFTAVLAAATPHAAAPHPALHAGAAAIRTFAHAHPIPYMLAFAQIAPAERTDPDAREAHALPLQALVAQISGEARSLAALRGLWALVHGFVILELNAQFERGGDLDATFAEVVRSYLHGIAATAEPDAAAPPHA